MANASPAGTNSVVREVVRLTSLANVHEAFNWFRSNGRVLSERQIEITGIPAPPFQEERRAQWLRERFLELGLEDVEIDGVGNVLALRRGIDPDAKFTALCAHLDTVFPEGTDLRVRRENERLCGPGISDNSSGIVALLAIAQAMDAAGLRTHAPLLFVGNVGEEGEGDLRGMRYIFADPRWRETIGYTVVLDGGGTDIVITQGLGSRRFLVTVHGPGGHSWSDFGVPNPIVLLAHAIDQFSRVPLPDSPRSAFNIGVISGGTSVNSIPESASMKVDMRSASPGELDRMESALRDALQQVVCEATSHSQGKRVRVRFEMQGIGDRPTAELRPGARILEVVNAVDAQLGIVSRAQRASTDANIPLSQGREAIALGAGGTGGGAHTLREWYDPTNRELGLRRILLATLALAGLQE